MRNIFLEKSCTKCGGQTISGPFSRDMLHFYCNIDMNWNQNWAYSRSIFYSFMCFAFIVCQVEGYRDRLELSCRPLALPHLKLFQKIKRGLEPVSLFISCMIFEEKYFCFFYLTKFQCLVVFTSWDIGQYVFCNCWLTMLWRQKCRN